MAEFLGMKMQQIQRYEAERYQSISLRRLEMIADALCLETSLTPKLSGNREISPVDLSNAASFPVGEMYRRGWFGAYRGTLIKALKEAPEQLAAFFERAYGPHAPLRRRYSRSRDIPHEPALLAWEARVMILADARPPATAFRPATASHDWLRTLIGFSAVRGGVKRIEGYLRDAGIVFLVEPALPGMQVDGAALRTANDVAVLALTVRDYRIESFWLALMHQLSHIILHIATGQYDAIFYERGAASRQDFEDEADVFARETLIPGRQWQSCKSQYTWTSQAIAADAKRLGVGPAIVLGRIQLSVGDEELPDGLIRGRDVRRQLAG
ncbi:MAG: hypothetical protein BGP17_08565 [Sphingomonas sp. 67-41]|nr:MAG: hypothetical protein BGP17_08565 [Sphingomonas sp. 67-41]